MIGAFDKMARYVYNISLLLVNITIAGRLSAGFILHHPSAFPFPSSQGLPVGTQGLLRSLRPLQGMDIFPDGRCDAKGRCPDLIVPFC